MAESNTLVKMIALVIPAMFILGSLCFVANDSEGNSDFASYDYIRIGMDPTDNIPENVTWENSVLTLNNVTVSYILVNSSSDITVKLIGNNYVYSSDVYVCDFLGDNDYLFTGDGTLTINTENTHAALSFDGDIPPPANMENKRIVFDGVKIEANYKVAEDGSSKIISADGYDVELISSQIRAKNAVMGIQCYTFTMKDSYISIDTSYPDGYEVVNAPGGIVCEKPVSDGKLLFYDDVSSDIPVEWSSNVVKIVAVEPVSMGTLSENLTPIVIGIFIVLLAITAILSYVLFRK